MISQEQLNDLGFEQGVWRKKEVYKTDGCTITVEIYKNVVFFKTKMEQFTPIEEVGEMIKLIKEKEPDFDADKNFGFAPQYSLFQIPVSVDNLEHLQQLVLFITGATIKKV